jgi:hypothetical protein
MISPFFNLKPMALEQVMSDRDSEDEVDDDIADFEDRRVCLLIMSLFFLLCFLYLDFVYNSGSCFSFIFKFYLTCLNLLCIVFQ